MNAAHVNVKAAAERKMKITRNQLRQIIKEEKARLISERHFTDRLVRAVVSVFEDALDMRGVDGDPEQAAQIIRDRVDNALNMAVKGIQQTADDDFDPDRY